ncbi:molybdopterin-synthase adenylyltransferase MoeB [Intrasporangium calvum]|uniref:Molybdopterin-synthase adenylyltransferase MoeB n=1 Tax=Intrasporangium calvum TaxID=53358 RepID=A0ABT5GL39_9MICO|nr:molybdopterin-synthase adenylyltransferase MoeB [Intrasporangium calvum]MDC5698610.1 molybdopterin-synthase adenylyltransferase MoeB [Intrasporangium calvum]
MPFEPLVKTGRELSGEEVTRYARHVLIPGVGRDGQERLAAARVLVVGAGGLGSPALLYLAAAGVGTIGVVDADVVELTNLHRQVIHSDADLGRPKTESAQAAVARVNPHVEVIRHDVTLDSANALEIIRDYDLVVDGTDNFPTRYLINDACVLLGKPHVWGSILRFDGQVSVWWKGHGPCYRCVFPEPPPPGVVPSCAEGGVFGILCAAIGSVQSTEAIKLLLGLGEPLTGRLLVHDALRQSWDTLTVRADPECPVCGDEPSITELIDYVEFCGVPGAPAAGEGAVPEVSVRQLVDELGGSRPPLLVDVRGTEERAIASIPGAVPIHLDRFRSGDAWGELPRDRRVLIHCKVGGRSAEATRLALRAGYVDVANVAGGVIAYLREIDPSQPEY